MIDCNNSSCIDLNLIWQDGRFYQLLIQIMSAYLDQTRGLQEAKQHVLGLLHREQQPFEEIYEDVTQDIDKLSQTTDCTFTLTSLQNKVIQIREQFLQQSTNRIALGQLSVNLIDSLIEMQHEHQETISRYEGDLQQLKCELQYANNKNINIEDDVEMFREQLRNAQEEMQQLTKDEQNQSESEVSQGGGQRERRMQELENQLDRLKQQLSIAQFQSVNKKGSSIHLSHKKLSTNMSQRFILSTTNSLKGSSQNKIFQYEIGMMKEKVKQLQMENQQLRFHLIEKMEANVLGESKSSAFMRSSSSKNMIEDCSEFKPLISQKSIQKFSILGREWSYKSIEMQNNCRNELIFLQQKDECLPGQTEQSQFSVKAEHKGMNTDKDSFPLDIIQNDKCLCKAAVSHWNTFIHSFSGLKQKIVYNRVEKSIKKQKRMRAYKF